MSSMSSSSLIIDPETTSDPLLLQEWVHQQRNKSTAKYDMSCYASLYDDHGNPFDWSTLRTHGAPQRLFVQLIHNNLEYLTSLRRSVSLADGSSSGSRRHDSSASHGGKSKSKSKGSASASASGKSKDSGSGSAKPASSDSPRYLCSTETFEVLSCGKGGMGSLLVPRTHVTGCDLPKHGDKDVRDNFKEYGLVCIHDIGPTPAHMQADGVPLSVNVEWHLGRQESLLLRASHRVGSAIHSRTGSPWSSPPQSRGGSRSGSRRGSIGSPMASARSSTNIDGDYHQISPWQWEKPSD